MWPAAWWSGSTSSPTPPDWDILGARLTGKDNPKAFFVSAGIDVEELFPCISGDLVVWQQRSADLPGPFAYGADIADPNKPRTFYTTMALGKHEIPGLSDGWLVGRETDEIGKVVVDNLFDPFNPEGISGSGLTACPKIHKHIVVWQDQSNGTWDIRGYNLVTRQEFVVTNMKMSDQVNPAVYVDTQAGARYHRLAGQPRRQLGHLRRHPRRPRSGRGERTMTQPKRQNLRDRRCVADRGEPCKNSAPSLPERRARGLVFTICHLPATVARHVTIP